MGYKTGIEWADATQNFWYGCTKVSAGCSNCYALRDMNRYGRDFYRVVKSKGFNKPLNWKKPAKVFVCSWSDFFIEEADQWRDDAWDIIKQQHHLTFQILTKREQRIKECLPKDWGDGYPNVWLGVTAENQEMADLRIPVLLDIQAAIRFVSCEPLLGGIKLPLINMIDWVIVGGESGPNCREMKLSWARLLKVNCSMRGVPFFMKQMSGRTKAIRQAIPEDLMIREFPDVTN